LVSKHFSFGDSGFNDADNLFLLSSGQQTNQSQSIKLRSLYDDIMDSYIEMERFDGSLGDFYTMKYRKALTTPTYSSIPIELQNQFLDYSHKETNTMFATSNWTNISARLNALSSSTEGNQFLTWGTKGFKTVFDFISVSFL
jgi:hypothetical protein